MGVFKPIIKKIIKPSCIAIIIFSLYGVMVIWYDNARDVDVSSAWKLVINGNAKVIENYTITLENYVLWPSALNLSLQYEKYNQSTESFEAIYPHPDNYQSHNFTLHEVSMLIYHGKKIVSGPYTLTYKIPHNYTSFHLPDFSAPPFTKVVTKVKFSYEYNREVQVRFSLISKPHSTSLKYINAMSCFDIQYPLNILTPIFLFLLSGFIYARDKKDTLSELIASNHFINALVKRRNSEKVNLESEIRILTHCPNLINDGQAVLLTPTTALLKMIVRRKITRLYHMRKIRKSECAEQLSTFLKDESTKPSSTLLEFRVIALVVGLLASIGFTLTWNITPIRPILQAFGLLILCFNLGFLFYVFKKSRRDIPTVALLVGLIIAVMILERKMWNLTNVFRGASRFIEELLSSNFGYG